MSIKIVLAYVYVICVRIEWLARLGERGKVSERGKSEKK